MKWFLSYLWINVANIKSEIWNKNRFWSSSKTRDQVKFYRLSGATFNDRINTIYKFIKPFEEYAKGINNEINFVSTAQVGFFKSLNNLKHSLVLIDIL